MSLIESQMDQYVRRCLNLASFGMKVSPLGDYIFHIEPENSTWSRSQARPEKDIPLTILALTHGVEVAGVAVLNELLMQVESGMLQLPFPICLALGNPWAAKECKRFIERDLNRSFGNPNPAKLREEHRAVELEKVLRRTEWFFDIHQTKEHSPQPFFIFPYSRDGFQFARYVAPTVPIITRSGGAFSKEGMCSDEFVNSVGGSGITIELGQNGFTPMALGVGVAACLRSIAFVQSTKQKLSTDGDPVWNQDYAPVYTWASVVDYPLTGEVSLRDDLVNFLNVQNGEKLGEHEGRAILANASGPILFPQHYRDRTQPRPKELIRIMRLMSQDEINAL